MTDALLSGGAKGADTLFDQCARKVGHDIENYSFEGHNSKCNDLIILNEKQLEEADPHLLLASKILGRRLNLNDPSRRGKNVANLLRRNYHQIKTSGVVYAVSWLNLEKQIIEGGTGWAVEMGRNKHIPVYIFDQTTEKWYTSGKNPGKRWIEISEPSSLYGRYTGIGSRNLTENGRAAIEKLYNNC